MNLSLIKTKKNLVIMALAILLVGAGTWYVLAGRNTAASYIFIPVKKGDLTKEIKGSSQVKAAQELNLAFERSGKLKTVNIKVGDQVKAGQVLAELDSSDVQADLSQSNAGVQVAEAQLKQLQASLELQKIKKQELLNGARSEDLQISETKIDSANKTINDAVANLNNVKTKADIDMNNLVSNIGNLLQDSYARATDVVNHQTNSMFAKDSNLTPNLTFAAPLNMQIEAQAEGKRASAEKAVEVLNSLHDQVKPDNSNYNELATEALTQLSVIRDYLITLNLALDSSVTSVGFPQAQLDAYKGYVGYSLGSINAAIANMQNYQKSINAQKQINQTLITAAETGVNSAKNSLASAGKEFDLKNAGATKEQLKSSEVAINQASAGLEMQQAQIRFAQASAYKISTQLDKTKIKAPIDGVITKFDLKVGEEVTANTPVLDMMTTSKFKIELKVSESEVMDVKVGDNVAVTLDTYGDENFPARVVSVDPAATVDANGISSYKIVLEFVSENDQIKPGLTANVKILAGQEKDVILVPEASVIKDGYDNYVIIFNGTPTGEKRKVEVSKIVQNGMTGIVSGLNENDKVADFINNTK